MQAHNLSTMKDVIHVRQTSITNLGTVWISYGNYIMNLQTSPYPFFKMFFQIIKFKQRPKLYRSGHRNHVRLKISDKIILSLAIKLTLWLKIMYAFWHISIQKLPTQHYYFCLHASEFQSSAKRISHILHTQTCSLTHQVTFSSLS